VVKNLRNGDAKNVIEQEERRNGGSQEFSEVEKQETGSAEFRVGSISSDSQRKKSNKRRGDAEIGGGEDACWSE
jgi:hypothetical protein